MRSQLDCYDSRLPGTGIFDIKTRAAFPIRLDIMNYQVLYIYLFAHESYGTNARPLRKIRLIKLTLYMENTIASTRNTTISSGLRS